MQIDRITGFYRADIQMTRDFYEELTQERDEKHANRFTQKQLCTNLSIH